MVVVTWMHPQVKIDGDLVLATKWGVNRMLVNVVSLALPGLHWVVVVALKQSVLRDVNERLQVVSFVVRRWPLAAGRWSLACRCKTAFLTGSWADRGGFHRCGGSHHYHRHGRGEEEDFCERRR